MESTPVLGTVRPSAPKPLARGFSLIEMMVVLAIITIITAIALAGQSTYNRTLILTNTAYTVAFTARQAQSFGLASRKFGSVQNAGYGIHLDRAYPNSYTFFADTSNTATPVLGCPLGTAGTPDFKPGNCRFDTTGTADGIVQKYTFSRGYTFKNFCVVTVGGLRTCSTDANPITAFDVVFTRPNTTAFISVTQAGLVTGGYSCADMTITDDSGMYTKSVRISSLGEITIGQTCS